MTFLVDLRYVHLLSSHVERFKAVGNNTWNFRCPLCGDSEHDEKKTRGYIFRDNRLGHEDRLKFKCHNCGKCLSFGNLLKHVSPQLYSQYLFSRLETTEANRKALKGFLHKKAEETRPETNAADYTTDFEHRSKIFRTVDDMPETHPLVRYLMKREIPKSWFGVLGYTSTFRKFTNMYKPDMFSEKALSNDYPALILPLRNEEGKVYGFQGRVFDTTNDNIPRYTTILLEDRQRLFNLNNVDMSKPFFVVEGPIDSMFLRNAVAVCGSDMQSLSDKENAIFVLDCEPRNKQIVKKYQKLIDAGCRVCILPAKTFAGMDINDMILAGYDSDEIEDLIHLHSFSGLQAQVEFSNWSKV